MDALATVEDIDLSGRVGTPRRNAPHAMIPDSGVGAVPAGGPPGYARRVRCPSARDRSKVYLPGGLLGWCWGCSTMTVGRSHGLGSLRVDRRSAWTWVANSRSVPALSWPHPAGSRCPQFVAVHYRHGGQVPDDVVGAVAGAVARVLNADPVLCVVSRGRPVLAARFPGHADSLHGQSVGNCCSRPMTSRSPGLIARAHRACW